MQPDLIPVGVCDDGCPAPFTVLGFHYNGDIGFAQFFNRSFDIFNGQPDDRPRSFGSSYSLCLVESQCCWRSTELNPQVFDIRCDGQPEDVLIEWEALCRVLYGDHDEICREYFHGDL